MPYLGQRPSKGDENNFKILDDISSYTLTFDGSDSSVVSAANDTITSLNHRFVQGQRVTYGKGSGGTAIAGLTDATVYYIIKHDHHNIKLATSASNATNGTAVNITGVAPGGSSHTLNVAFDGTNTKFKATHTNGQKAKITRSAQLVISINGVIQQPHDSATPSTGFGFDLDGTIVFSQAPVAGDVYWAHVLTNNNVTFDISDNHIDRFIGNASTTAFNLSKSPPDNRNVLVTIDGVVQYPNDPDGTVRAYNVVENVLTFTTAPATGTEIQVRHIGFAGSSSGSGGVTNFYGRTGSVVLKSTDNITVNDAAITGNATVTGDLTVNGTTTTLDTTLQEVDQLFVSANNTSYAGIITQTGSGNILGLFDGSTRVFNVADGGAISTKALTVTGDIEVVDSTPRIKITDSDATGNAYAFIDGQAGQLKLFADLGNNVNGSEIVFGVDSNTAKMVIKDTGNVGINSAIPSYELVVSPTDTNESTLQIKAGGNGKESNVYFGAPDDDDVGKISYDHNGDHMKFVVGTVERFRSSTDATFFNSTGADTDFRIRTPAQGHMFFVDAGNDQVTIKTSSAQSGAVLTVNGRTHLEQLTLGNNSTLDAGAQATIYKPATNTLAFATAGANERLRIDSNGRVGIGTETPGAKLSIIGGSIGSGAINALELKHYTTNNTGDGTALLFNGGYQNNAWAFAKISAVNSGSGFGADLQVHVHPADGTQGSSVVKALSIVGDGSSGAKIRIPNAIVGIGTDNPTSKLDVVGDVKITGIVTSTTFVGNLTGEASQVTIGNGANNRIITASGTNTLDCAGNFTFGGNVMEIGAAGAEGGALYINGGTINNPGGRDAKLWIEDPTSNDWAININKTGYNYGIQMHHADSASHAFYIVGSGAERFRITGSGEIAKCASIFARTADTFDIGDNGTSRWRSIYAQNFYGSSSIFVGTTTAGRAGADELTIGDGSGDRGITIRSGTSNEGNIYFSDSNTAGNGELRGIVRFDHSDDSMQFWTASGNNFSTEKLRITSGGTVNIGGNFTQTTYKAQIQTGTNKFISFTNAAHDDLSDEGSGIIFSRQNDGSKELSGIFGHSNSGLGIAARGVITFHAGGSSNYGSAPERLRITSGGTIQLKGQGASNANPRLLIEDGAGGSNDFSISQYEDANGTYTLIGQNVQLNGSGSEVIQDSNHKTASMYLDARNNGAIIFNTGGTNSHTERLRINSKGQLLHGNSSEDQGWAVFWNAAGSGADAGTAGADGGGDQGVNIRSDMGPTHLDLTGVDNYTLKLSNQAYAGAGIANPQGTISKILFNTATYNGWNSYGAICLDSQGASAARGEMVFMLNNDTSSMNEKMRIKSTLIHTSNGVGMEIYGQNTNHPNDTVFYVNKTGNADWCIKAAADGHDYGIYSRVANNASYSIASYDTTNAAWRFRINGAGAIYATNTTVQSISDVRLKENIVDANSQWNDIKALRFRNFNWKSDSGYADGKTYLGLIAQEVEPISPNLIEIDAQTKEDIENGVTDPEYKNVKYSIVWMKAVKALQEAQARIETLEAKVAALEGS